MLKFILSLFIKKQQSVSIVKTNIESKEEKMSDNKIKCWNFTEQEYTKKMNMAPEDMPAEHRKNLQKLLKTVNELGTLVPDNLKGPRNMSSGYRSKEYQINVYKNLAKQKKSPFTDGVYVQSKVPLGSAHMTGEAMDINDPDNELDEWLMSDEGKKVVEKLDIYLEHKDYTDGWCHVQIRKPKSGNHYFIP